jgi:nucleotide-binding universal stress UspA family protein
MAYAQVLGCLSGVAEEDAAVLASLTALGAGHAEAAFALPDPTTALLMAGPGVMPALGGAAVDLVAQAQSGLQTRVRTATEAAGVNYHFYQADPATALGDLGLLADLVVVPSEAARGHGALGEAVERLLLRLRVPVMAVSGPLNRTATVCLAWDGSAEALRAARAALPILARAETVVVLQDPERIDAFHCPHPEPQSLVNWLAQRDVTARTESVSEGLTGVLSTAKALGADVLVAGAYGHARAMEVVFGGATRSLLAQPQPFALLMAH